MFDFLKKTPQKQGIIALDIGTEAVKAALFIIEEKQNTNGEVIGRRSIIKGFSKIPQRQGEFQNGITDIGSVVRNCQEAIRIAAEQAKLKPAQIVIGIAGEYVKGATSTLTYTREEPETKINIAELRNMVHKLQWKAFAEVRKKLSEETGYPEIDVKLVHAAIVDIRIDGYKVTNPIGFQGKEVQMSLFNAFAPLGQYGAIQTIADDLGLELLGIVSEPYALSKCMQQEEGGLTAIFIDIGGGITDITAVREGAVVGTRMFGIGGRTFSKRLSMELNLSYEEAEKLKIAYTEDRLEQKSKKIVSDIVNGDIEIWLEGILLALSEFKEIEVLPSKILLSGGGSHLPEIKTTLNTTKWYKKLPFAHTPEARFIHPSDLGSSIDETKRIKDQSDITPMALVNIGMELASEESPTQKVLKKVIGIMKV